MTFYRKILYMMVVACLFRHLCQAQEHLMRISGTVTDSASRSPLDHASVYLNNTTIGATTNEKGSFVLTNIPVGKYDLIISYLGFKTRVIPINEPDDNKDLNIQLQPDITQLKGVVVRSGKQDKDYLVMFEKYFIGTDDNAAKCEILNPEALLFDFDQQTLLLTAQADQVLVIRNKALGYKIYYDLQYFRFDSRQYRVTYFGHTRFENLPARSRRQQRIWSRNRIKNYLGSMRHFMKSLALRKLKEEGFEVRKLIKVTDSHTVSASSRYSLGDGITRQTTGPATSNFIYSTTLPYDSIIGTPSGADSGRVKLKFNNSLYVIPFYYKTPDKNAFFRWKHDTPLSGMTITKTTGVLTSTAPAFPPSILTMTRGATYINRNGVLSDPIAVTKEGGWAHRHVSDLLPVDYEMPEQK